MFTLGQSCTELSGTESWETVLAPKSCTKSLNPGSWINSLGARVLLAKSRPVQIVGKTMLAPESCKKSRPVQIVGKAVLASESCTQRLGPDSWKNNVGARVLHRVARSRKLEKQCWHPSLAQSRPVQGVGETMLAPKSCTESPGPGSWKTGVGARGFHRAARAKNLASILAPRLAALRKNNASQLPQESGCKS